MTSIVLLEVGKFKRLTGNFKGGAFVAKSNSNCGRSISREKNDRVKSR